MDIKINLTGLSFGLLTVIEFVGKNKHNQALWKCTCSCPERSEIIVAVYRLTTKNTKSCGCLQKQKVKENNISRSTHGLTNNKFYPIWNCIISRCYNTKNKAYHNYGGRGITVCDEWQSDPTEFIVWAEKQEHTGEKGYSIDRRDNNLGYSPDNCWFRTGKEQSRNRRDNINVNIYGESLTLVEAVEKYGAVKYNTVVARIFRSNWDIIKAILTKSNIKLNSNQPI